LDKIVCRVGELWENEAPWNRGIVRVAAPDRRDQEGIHTAPGDQLHWEGKAASRDSLG